ncbi:MAG: CRISPR-associated protein Cas4 [Candidatus Lokiarchaeota archaeon]|nr:CRISPR-associated protein Cas4 [Candidatus Lokiarchaeota archaeon]
MDYLEKRSLKKYVLSEGDINIIRLNYPKIHLYTDPLIGTEEIRQYVYCKRIIFFRRVVNAPMKQTYKMELGQEKHEKLQQLSQKSNDNPQKYYNIYLTDYESGLVGVIDFFEFDGNEAYPVEIKSGNIPPDDIEEPHKLQVTAQAILIEKNFDFLVKKVKIVYSKYKKYIEYPILIEDKLKVLKIVGKIRKLIEKEEIPHPTIHEGKCVDCECKNYCLRS